ncbi:hypothetical protein SBI63_23445 [Mycolicibacterium sp. 120270]|nr:hypothetical protein [Mycolicibacterium sp. 120270]MDX1886312.1 hypothetical protein [Mycolicibacterium sp. 120270]
MGDLLVAEPLADEPDHVVLGGGQRRPAARRPLTLAAAALRIGDRLFGRQGRALRPRRFEVVGVHGVSERIDRRLVAGLVDGIAHRTLSVPDGLRCAEKPSRLAVPGSFDRNARQEIENVGNAQIRADVCERRKCVMGVSFGVFWSMLGDREPCANRVRQSKRQPGQSRDGLLHQAL